jgi:GT2 family glycosyltransferase
MRASLVIAAHNEGDLLAKTIQSCLDTMAGLDCEIVVVDDASQDGSVEQLQRRFHHVRKVTSAARLGVAATKDSGARHARGDVLLFLDGHCKPEPGALGALIEAVEEWDGAAVVTPSVAALDVSRWESGMDLLGHGYSVNLASGAMSWLDLDQMQTLRGPRGGLYYQQPTMIGCCAAMGRELYQRVLGFDVGMRYYGVEDVDFGVKAWLMGFPVLHAPDPVIGHRFQTDFASYAVPAAHVDANMLRFARKTLGDAAWSSWIGRFDAERGSEWWQRTWAAYVEGKLSLERERKYLLAHRKNDEYWFAATFGQDWPRTGQALASPPAPLKPGGRTAKPSPTPTPPPTPSPKPTAKP